MRLLVSAINRCWYLFVVSYQRLAAVRKSCHVVHFSFSFLYHVAAVSMNSYDSDDSTSSSVRLARTLQSSSLAKNTSMLWLFAPEKHTCHFRTIWPISLEWYNPDLERFAEVPGVV